MQLNLDSGPPPVGFDSWDQHADWVAQGGSGPAPAAVGGDPSAPGRLAATLAAQAAAARATLAAQSRQLSGIPEGYYQTQELLAARDRAIASARAEEAGMRADPRWQSGDGVASTVITATTPGVDLSKPYGITPTNVPTFSYDTRIARKEGDPMVTNLPSGDAATFTTARMNGGFVAPGLIPLAPSTSIWSTIGGIAGDLLGGIPGVSTIGSLVGGGSCPPGTEKKMGIGPGGGLLTECRPVGVTDPILGGPYVTGGGTGTAVVTTPGGSYGMAIPSQVARLVRRCPTGMVLNKQGLCQDLPSRSKDRLHRPGAKPLLTGGEMNAIRTAARAKKRLVKAANHSGAFARLTRPSPCATKRKK